MNFKYQNDCDKSLKTRNCKVNVIRHQNLMKWQLDENLRKFITRRFQKEDPRELHKVAILWEFLFNDDSLSGSKNE